MIPPLETLTHRFALRALDAKQRQRVAKWLETLAIHGYPAAGGFPGTLARDVVGRQLQGGRERGQLEEMLAALHDAAVKAQDEAHLIRLDSGQGSEAAVPEAVATLLEFVAHARPAVEAALVLLDAPFLHVPPPRQREFHPAALWHDLLAVIGEGDARPPVAAAELAREVTPATGRLYESLQALREAAQGLSAGFGRGLPWPTPAQAAVLARALAIAEPWWIGWVARETPRGVDSDARRRRRELVSWCSRSLVVSAILAQEHGAAALAHGYHQALAGGIQEYVLAGEGAKVAHVAACELAPLLAQLPDEPGELEVLEAPRLVSGALSSEAGRKALQRGRDRCVAAWVRVDPADEAGRVAHEAARLLTRPMRGSP